jgi:hypothetical protein
MDLLEIGRLAILGILVLVAAVGVPLIIGYYILHPIDVLMRKSKRKLQFTLVDFACLLLEWQIALGFTLSQVPSWDSQYFVLIFGFLAASVLLIWLGGIYSLSRLGVESARRRITFLIALPGIVASMMLAAAAFGSVPAYALRLIQQDWAFDLPINLESASRVTAVVAIAAVVTFIACRLLRRVMHWVVADCQARQNEAGLTA